MTELPVPTPAQLKAILFDLSRRPDLTADEMSLALVLFDRVYHDLSPDERTEQGVRLDGIIKASIPLAAKGLPDFYNMSDAAWDYWMLCMFADFHGEPRPELTVTAELISVDEAAAQSGIPRNALNAIAEAPTHE